MCDRTLEHNVVCEENLHSWKKLTLVNFSMKEKQKSGKQFGTKKLNQIIKFIQKIISHISQTREQKH